MQVGEIVQRYYLTSIKTTYHVMYISLWLLLEQGARQCLAMISSEAEVHWVSFDCSATMFGCFVEEHGIDKYHQCYPVIWC